MKTNSLSTPCLILDREIIKKNYQLLAELLPMAKIYFAVKANPISEVLNCLIKLNSYFDVASLPEIKILLDKGVPSTHLCYGNPIKKKKDILESYQLGIRQFVVDSVEELKKIASVAPKAKVFYRLSTSGKHAQWALSNKFGCTVFEAKKLIEETSKTNLIPYGISFHVGSQQLDPLDWEQPIAEAAYLFKESSKNNIELQVLNIGGGFPVEYKDKVFELSLYAETIKQLLSHYFPDKLPQIIIEPGRQIVGNAAIILTEVILVAYRLSEKNVTNRWIYLDIGKYSGLAETKYITYFVKSSRTGELSPAVLAGPTCDSTDVFAEGKEYLLPNDIQSGDLLKIYAAGAYTFSCCSIGFNGFSPLNVYVI